MLDSYINIVENDVSSIVYHTRVFDTFILSGIENFYSNTEISVIPSFLFCSNIEFLLFYSNYSGLFFILYKDVFLALYENINILLSLDNKIFSFSIINIFLMIY
jgi:hypothetical protein